MQQTKLDHWLKRKFVDVHRVYCQVLPDDLPPRLDIEEAPDGAAGARYRLTPPNERVMSAAVDRFRMQRITFSSRVESRTNLLARRIDRERHSFTWDTIWMIIGVSTMISLVGLGIRFIPFDTIMESFLAVFSDLKSDLLKS